MIIAYKQKRDLIDISYVNPDGKIENTELILKNGYYTYAECLEDDPNIIGLKSFKGSCVKKEPAKYFTHHNINEFFNKDIPDNYPEFHEKTKLLIQPKPFSIDIEVMPTDKYGYSPPTDANNPITSISFTDENLNSILFIIKNDKYAGKFNDLDLQYIDGIIKDALGKHCNEYKYDRDIRIFDTEVEMLNTFLECFNKYFHLLIGWNVLTYDWLYIYNRCVNLGIDVKKASPIRSLTGKKIAKPAIELKIPTHRVIVDYMLLFKESLIYNNLGSYSLNAIAEKILDLQKVSYNGNLRTLYNEDYLRFVAYSFVDTILVMLIHKTVDLLTVDFFQSYYTKVPYTKLSQNSISEALIYQELRNDNIFLLESEKTNNKPRPYQGGYVKAPTKKMIDAGMGEDYGALYPNCIIAMGLSPEMKVDEISVTKEGTPKTESDNIKWQKYKKMGYSLSPMGRIYDMSYDGLYVRIEKKLLEQRNIFRGYEDSIYLDLIPQIEAELKTR